MSGLAPWLHGFLTHVERDGNCWIWTAKTKQGYGVYGGRSAHRDAYQRLVGPIPDGLELDHLCRRPACVNPLHMQPVTRQENRRRRYAAMTHCKHGHEFTPENTRVQGGSRHCRTCDRRRRAEYLARKKEAQP